MNSDSYQVELTGPGLSLKRELTETHAHELLIWLVKGGELEASAQPTDSALVGANTLKNPAEIKDAGARRDRPLTSVREFLDEFAPRRVPDRIACFGLYLREHRDHREFSKADIISLFQEAAEPLPKNLGRDLRWTQSIAWIAPSPSNRESFYLTKKGEDAVRNHFPKETVAKTRQPAASQRRRSNGQDSAELKVEEKPTSPP